MSNSTCKRRHGFIVHPDDWRRISDGVEPAVLGSALVRVIGDAFTENPRDSSADIPDLTERLIYGFLWDRNCRDHRQYEKRTLCCSAKKSATADAEIVDTGGAAEKGGAPKFVKPTLEEVRGYCREKGYTNVDAADFVDYYESNGWKVGRVPMKDWRRTVNRWHRSGGTRRQDARPAGQVLREREVGHDEHEYKL